ncbi:MAG: flagellar motor switch protein FliN [Armatimonadia bacterium]
MGETPAPNQEVPALAAGRPDLANLAAMLDVPLRITVELGRAELPLAEVLALKPGSVVELDRFPGEPLDLYANGRLVARGEIIVLNDIFGFRITDILMSPTEAVNAR